MSDFFWSLLLPIFYLVVIVFLETGIYLNRRRMQRTGITPKKIRISVIIPFHNERDIIGTTHASISQLSNSQDYEFIWVNDRSRDGGEAILAERIAEHDNHQLVTNHAEPKGKLSGKKLALDLGIQHASGDYVVLTDADCHYPEQWLQNIESAFLRGADLYFGPVIKESPGLLGHMIRFEQAINHRIGEAFSGYRYPLLVFGANWGGKKSLLTAGGGFASLRRSLSGDDDLMVQGMAKHKLRFVWDAGNPVHTKSARSLSHLYRQKRRHLKAGQFYNAGGKLFYGIWHSLQLSFPIAALLAPGHFYLLIFKVLADALWPKKTESIFILPFYSLIFQIFYIAENWIIGIISLIKMPQKW
jgi:biofilm PGA synthesis N-glycosyltransferase PgaC